MQAGREIKFRGKPIEDYGDTKWFFGSAVLNYEDKLAYIEAYGTLLKYMIDHDGEVIGNIHDNPELLEVGK